MAVMACAQLDSTAPPPPQPSSVQPLPRSPSQPPPSRSPAAPTAADLGLDEAALAGLAPAERAQILAVMQAAAADAAPAVTPIAPPSTVVASPVVAAQVEPPPKSTSQSSSVVADSGYVTAPSTDFSTSSIASSPTRDIVQAAPIVEQHERLPEPDIFVGDSEPCLLVSRAVHSSIQIESSSARERDKRRRSSSSRKLRRTTTRKVTVCRSRCTPSRCSLSRPFESTSRGEESKSL